MTPLQECACVVFDNGDPLVKIGSSFGYFLNAIKTYLVAKLDKVSDGTEIFNNTDVQITCAGRRYLGRALGTEVFEQQFLETKIGEWVKETAYLAKMAKSQPHAAYAAYTHGLISPWTYTLKVCPQTPEGVLRPLEEVISNELIPNPA